MERLVNFIEKGKPYARFDKAALYRKLDSNEIAKIVANKLPMLLDERKTIQQYAAILGKAIIGPFDSADELEQDINKGYQLCGYAIIKGLLNEDILYKRLEKVVAGTAEDGSKIYKTVNVNGKTLIVKQWNLYVKDKDFVEHLWLNIDVEINHKGSPTVNEPKKRIKFFDYEAGALVTNVNRNYIKRFSATKLPIVYKQINDLQQTPWLINQNVLHVASKLKNHNLLTKMDKNLDAEARTGLQRDVNITMAQAREIRDRKCYFYWFLDTRGRFYCGSDYLNPQSGDLQKGLLKLADAKALGKKGLYWLKIHIANSIGFDKLSIEERFNIVESNLELILEVFRSPVMNVWWWKGVSSPFVTLAACMDLYEAYELADPTEHISSIPVGFDATCSGLQIFAMLARDEITGKLTNLTDSDEIGDVYMYIADKIDWNSSDYWKKHYDERRKIVKRSVMTFFYSCGKAKMAQHIYTDFKADFKGLTKQHCETLGTLIYMACKKYLPGASKIMDLFIKIGTTLAEKNQLIYIPGMHNGFPFIQSYMIPETDRIDFKNGKERITLTYVSKRGARLNVQKITTGSSPNIIHHLDSQIVSKLLSMVDYTVAPTHDCFYSVAADADNLYDDIRAAFYELFGENDVLQQICDSFKVKNTIKYGKLNTQHCLVNQYCFS